MSVAEDERGATLRELQKAETRARVVDAARALFTEKGYEAATIRDIAARAGVAPGSVFTTFASKTELLQEIIFNRYEEMLPALTEAAQQGSTARERIEASCRTAYAFELRELRLLGETIAASYRWSESEEAENRRRLAPLFGLLLSMIVWARDRGEIRHDIQPELLAEMVFACYLRNFRRALFDGADADALGDDLSRQIGVLFEGVKPPG